MSDNYINFFKDIDQTITNQFGAISPIPFKIFGFTALALAGLPDRGTKDVDVMDISAVAGSTEASIIDLILKEFGKKSPGLYRHGMYIDIVHESVPWIPSKSVFEPYKNLDRINLSLLNPTDVCVSKVFSYFKSRVRRANDRQDIIAAFDQKLIHCKQFLHRLDEALSVYETHAEAPEIYPKVVHFIHEEIIPNYDSQNITLGYEIPNWMENM